jgi:hypothetical protein
MDYNFSPNIVREVREVEWEIRKYIKFPMDPKTGQKYIYSNGQVSCIMCNRKVTQKGLTRHSNSCRNKFLANRIRFEDKQKHFCLSFLVLPFDL